MDDSLQTGSLILHYRIVSKIGAGGMGEVYLAEDTELERRVGLKILRAEIAGDEDRLRRFVLEAKAASALNHPNILTVFEIGSFEGSRYIATEFIKGETLRERMRGEPFTLRETLEIVLQIAAALGAAHDASIIHRDIKPENIMIRDDGLVKVLDFGLAKLSEPPTPAGGPDLSEDATKVQFSTQPGIIMGTVAYMSPEQARGQRIDARSDIFSLGIVMFELFTGKRPFEGETHLDLISSILKDETPLLRHIAPGLPRQLERIVDKTLRKDRDHRYQHVKDLHIDLEDLGDELKFEAKLNQTVEPTVALAAHVTNADDFRSAFTTSVAATRRFTLLHAFLFTIITAALLGSVLFYFSFYNRSPAIADSLKVTDVASWSSAPGELVAKASFSPDGKMIAFASTKSGTKNIWVTQTASTEAIQVTNDNYSNTNPIWSPKGDEIAYFSQKANLADRQSNSTGVWRVPALGGTPKSVGAISDGSSQLRRWTASGKIYFQSGNDLHVLDMASGTSRPATSFGEKGLKVKWASISADEKSIAYTTQNEAAWTLFVGDASGVNPTKVAEGPGEVEDVAWVPEKKRIFYSAIVNGVFQVFVTDIGSGRSVRITSSETDSVVIDAAPDGRSVIFSSAREESNLWRINTANSQETPLARDLNSKLWPAVSPDNAKMAFQSIKNLSAGNHLMESSIVVKPVKTRDEGERPTLLAENGYLPTWSPDGTMLAFMRRSLEGVVALLAANPNGGGERLLTSGGIPVIGYSVSPYNHVQTKAFAWSPDSSKIAYISERGGASNIWAVSTRDAADASLTNNTNPELRFSCPIWSPDGRMVAFSTQRTGDDGKQLKGLKIHDVQSLKTAEVLEKTSLIRLIGWTADGSGLIFAEADRSGALPSETVLNRVAVAGGAETVIARLKNVYYYNIFLSEDRKNIAYAARNQDKDDIWIIPSTGGEGRKLTGNNDSDVYFSRLAWLPDGSAIVFGKQTRFSLLSIINDIQ